MYTETHTSVGRVSVSDTENNDFQDKRIRLDARRNSVTHISTASDEWKTKRIIQSHIQSICVWNKFISIFLSHSLVA